MTSKQAYINAFETARKELAANIRTKGVEASDTEKFNTLVPKVLEIETVNSDVEFEELYNKINVLEDMIQNIQNNIG